MSTNRTRQTQPTTGTSKVVTKKTALRGGAKSTVAKGAAGNRKPIGNSSASSYQRPRRAGPTLGKQRPNAARANGGAATNTALSKRARSLNKALGAIKSEVEILMDGHHSPSNSPTGVLKRRVYALARSWIIRHMPLRETLAELGDRPARASALSGNQFHWILSALHRRGLVSSSSERRRLANELQYARRHDVPVQYVVGFLLQTGAGEDIYRRVSDPDCREAEIPLTPRRRREQT